MKNDALDTIKRMLTRPRATGWAGLLLAIGLLVLGFVPTPAQEEVVPLPVAVWIVSWYSIAASLGAALLLHGFRPSTFHTLNVAGCIIVEDYRTEHRISRTLAREMPQVLVLFALAILAAIVGLWLVHLASLWAALALVACLASVLWIACRGQRAAFWFLSLLMGIPLIGTIRMGDYWAAGAFAAVLSALFGYGLLTKRRRRSARSRRPREGAVRDFVTSVLGLSRHLRRYRLSTESMVTYQGLIVAAAIMGYAVIPLLLPLFPPELSTFTSSYGQFLAESFRYLPVVAFGAYCGLSVTEVAGLIADVVIGVRPGVAVRVTVSHLAVIAATAVATILVLAGPGYLLAATLLTLTRSPLETLVSLVLGFFVFPAWVAELLALFVALLMQGVLGSLVTKRSRQLALF